MSYALFLSSWPTSLAEGSGAALFVTSLKKAVEAQGRPVVFVNPKLKTSDYTQFTLDRFTFNIRLADKHQSLIDGADWIFGLDYDGFALPRQSGRPFIVSVRSVFADLVDTEPEPFKTLLRAQSHFEGHNVRQADCITTPSEYARQKIIEYYQVDERRVHAIPNGIDLDQWDSLWATIPEPDPYRRPTVLAVSKLYPRKNISTLLRAIPELRNYYPDIDVRIVGAGFEWNELHQLSCDLGITGNVTWLGDINDRRSVVAEYKNCHVFVHPSVQDAFANVCLESMASSRPLVVSDAAAMPALVRTSSSGLIVPPRNPEAFADAIRSLLENRSLRDTFGKNGRAFAESMTWRKTSEAHLSLIETPETSAANLGTTRPERYPDIYNFDLRAGLSHSSTQGALFT